MVSGMAHEQASQSGLASWHTSRKRSKASSSCILFNTEYNLLFGLRSFPDILEDYSANAKIIEICDRENRCISTDNLIQL